MELSIIIPAYNCISTIEKTIKSIVIQELDVNFEVIIVNDCSNYNYSNIVNKYNKEISIKEIKTPKNIGPGGARQFGIDNSISKYIIFIDGDDLFYDKNSISKMYNEIQNKNADITICNFIYEHDNKKITQKQNIIFLHGKIYKREFINNYNIRFNNTRSNEDQGFNMLLLFMNPKISYLNETVYIYKENANSITRKNSRLYQFEGLEWLCYNINWAIEEAMKRGINSFYIEIEPIVTLVSLYNYYIDLQHEYDVSKILLWAKELYKKYISNAKKIDNDQIDGLIKSSKDFFKDYFNIKEYNISFYKFLDMIKEKNNI